jgi:tetratricopeptide (TPR) repeat protein
VSRRLVATLCAILALAPAVARADTVPSRWERARDPEAAEAYDLHRAVQQRLVRTTMMEIDLGERGRVLAMLERAGAEHGKSALLRFDLGEVYWLLEDHARAAQIYKAAISEFPDHPAVEQAWFRVAVACGHVGDHACERDAYVSLLRLETEEILRATPTLNLAEVEMHRGDLREAIEGYREALRISGRVPAGETAPLASWGLAVALDRSGDRVGAEVQARFALEIERSMGVRGLLRSSGVFFFPKYEIHWYEGLGFAAQAEVASTPREALKLWQRAERSFSEYVAGATPRNDRWLPIAEARLSRVRAERARAEKAAARLPSAARSTDEDMTP